MLTSMQVAELSGSFQQQHADRMQYASMLGTQPGYANLSENVVGGAMNRGAAVGGPLANAGMALMGWDPLSQGLKAGMGAFRMGSGAMGAGAAGMAAAGFAAAPMMAAQYAGGQMMQGAQQQQQFNSSMRASYSFMNPAGGTGFSRGDMGDISGAMRGMSTQQGPGGEMVGFAELGRLASNMGRMGMAQGVRDAKDFNEKFKVMVKSLKEIATEMGTSMEEAQKMMGAMRSSGVFGNKNSSSFASMIHSGAIAGGLAASEVTGMMNIGSQISRSIGGRGRAGAKGGLDTITNIGVAQQMGVISDEDVYNATGLTGAEGRRALATQQMSSSAQFLKGGLGRRFLASISGKNGELDSSSVEEYMAGGVGTSRTMDMAHRNLGKVGRANFIRNEGRLRGEALGQFGGLAPAMVMKGWLDERGIDLNESQDKAMIFMQRRLGLGRDEADVMMKQVQNLPQLLQQRKVSKEDDAFSQKLAVQQSHKGLEGIKHKFEKAKADVDSGLQKVGADFYQEMSESVERYVNKLTGNYVTEFHRDVGRAFESGMRGGAGGKAEMARMFGSGNTGVGRGLSSMGASDVRSFKDMDMGDFKDAGYDVGKHAGVGRGRSQRAMTAGDINKTVADASAVSMAFQTGGRDLKGFEGVSGLGTGAAADIRRMAALGGVQGKGFDRLDSYKGILDNLAASKGGEYAALRDRYAKAGRTEQAQIAATLGGSAGLEGEASMFAVPTMKSVLGSTQYATQGEKHEAMGKALMGTEGSGRIMGFLKGLVGIKGPSEQQVASAGKYLESEEGRDLASRITSGDSAMRDAAGTKVEKELLKLQQKGKDNLTDADKGQMSALKGLLFSKELSTAKSPQEADAIVAKLAKESGMSPDEVKRLSSGAMSVANDQRDRNVMEAAGRYGSRAREGIEDMEAGGLLRRDAKSGKLVLDKDVAAKAGGVSSAAKSFVENMVSQQQSLAELGQAGQTADQARGIFDAAQKAGGLANRDISSMSVAEQRKLAESLQGVGGAGSIRSELLAQASTQARIEKAGKGGGTGAIAKMLGVNLSAAELKKLGSGGTANAIAEELGISSGSGAMKDLQEAITAASSGKSGAAALALRHVTSSDEFVGAQQKKALAKQEAENPLQAQANKHLQTISDSLEAMKKTSSSQLSALSTIADKASPYAESK